MPSQIVEKATHSGRMYRNGDFVAEFLPSEGPLNQGNSRQRIEVFPPPKVLSRHPQATPVGGFLASRCGCI
jgi:hypothetical protein